MAYLYGTPEYYAELFMDIIADIGALDTVEENITHGSNILQGFELAMNGWIDYHKTAALSYEKIREQFHDLGS
jgi:hypothetical protein